MKVKAFVHSKLGNTVAEIEGSMYWLMTFSSRDANGDYTVRNRNLRKLDTPVSFYEDSTEWIPFVVDIESSDDDILWNLSKRVPRDLDAVNTMVRRVSDACNEYSHDKPLSDNTPIYKEDI